MGTRLEMDWAKVNNRLKRNTDQARMVLKNEVVKDTEPYVPMQGGYLKNSPYESIRKKDDTIVYDAPYSRFLYYGKVMVGKKSHSPWAKRGETKVVTNKAITFGTIHPLACAFWFEKSKSMNKEKWLRLSRKVYKNG